MMTAKIFITCGAINAVMGLCCVRWGTLFDGDVLLGFALIGVAAVCELAAVATNGLR